MFALTQGALIENGIDFLEKALDEFKENPKYSILHFSISIEILLKARLSIEHWSLVVQKNAAQQKYLDGDFQSVNLDESIKRLKDIVGEQITEQEYRSFKKMAAHRNKVIHFFHNKIADKNSTEIISIIKEQCECWYHLKSLFLKRWKTHFEKYTHRFESLDHKMKRHWEYLSVIFKNKKPEIKKFKNNGLSINTCNFCHFESVPSKEDYSNFFSGNCLVCGWHNTWLELDCECGEKIIFDNEGYGNCQSCDLTYEPNDLAKILTKLSSRPAAHCSFCDGAETVVEFHDNHLCTQCFSLFSEEEIQTCDYCGDRCTGDMSESSWKGCVLCSGSLGNL